MTPKAFIVTLMRCKERVDKSMQEAVNAGIDFDIIEAMDARAYKNRSGEVDWRKLQKDQPFTNSNWGDKFKASEVCIYASHLKAYREILEQDLDGAFVLEDDFCLQESPFGLQEVARELPSQEGWMHCMLHHENLHFNPDYKVIGQPHEMFYRVRQTPLIGVAYAASRRFCEYFLKHYSIMDAPHDHAMCRISQNPNLTFLQTSHAVCASTGFQSTQE